MDNQFFIVDATNGLQGREEDEELHRFKVALDSGYEIKRCYTTNNVMLFHIAEVEEEEAVVEPMIESVVEIALDDNPETIKKWTSDGWTVKTFYSKKVQLVKMKETEKDESCCA